ncbi:MAG: Zn-ribbon domain-containing OB-fold protein [Deltaproteobacteria bacterium]|nr:Zn-ribbon domain-containing OB-fold protein [Deltaproteobacteria bacterium]
MYKEKIEKNIECGSYPGQIPVNYVYTLGIAGDEFFRAIRDKGYFIASKCSCGKKYIPAQMYCDECFGECNEYEKVGTEGELYSYTECYYDYQGKRYEEPHLIGLIKFKGYEGGIIHRLNISRDEIKIGMKVEAVFKPQKQRTGSIEDILYFRKK